LKTPESTLIPHKGAAYSGEHAAIISRELYEQVQSQLDANTTATRTGARAREPSLLAGILFDDGANRMTPSHCTKAGSRYRYYFSQATLGSTDQRGIRRVPAGELESLVVRRLSAFLASGKSVLDAGAKRGHRSDP